MIRKITEQIEFDTLSPSAQKSAQTKGRVFPLPPCEIRTEYQRDRDRILHCKSFRCLKHKTQVFISPDGDYYRTRLTHTLEVSQIARTISRALRLNEDLTEAIALGHDLGHTPFGHAGERALRACVGAFEHNEQSLRIVDLLENGTGLNLTWEVRDGILNHKKNMQPATLEGLVVNYSDRIAYLNHDIDDAVRAQLLCVEDIPQEITKRIGMTHGQRIDAMIRDLVDTAMRDGKVAPSEEMAALTDLLREFMFETVYCSKRAQEEDRKVEGVIHMLYEHYMTDEREFAKNEQTAIERYGRQQAVADYIAGMSDRFAMKKFEEYYIPKIWV